MLMLGCPSLSKWDQEKIQEETSRAQKFDKHKAPSSAKIKTSLNQTRISKFYFRSYVLKYNLIQNLETQKSGSTEKLILKSGFSWQRSL